MLQRSRFKGDRQQVLQSSQEFWKCFKKTLQGFITNVYGNFDAVDVEREIKFYDTAARSLNKNDYIFRERCDAEADLREVTLKFRHPDRYFTRDRDMSFSNSGGRLKLEEDIKSPFTVLYSFSSTQPVKKELSFSNLTHLADLYPAFAEELNDYDAQEPLEQVGTTMRELVIKGASFRLRSEPELKADCSITIWYEQNQLEEPAVVEFSYKYKDENEAYTKKIAKRAHDAFLMLQTELTDWVDSESQTKTAYMYRAI